MGDGHWARATLNDNLRACADAGEQTGEVADYIGIRNVDHCHIHSDTPLWIISSGCCRPRPPDCRIQSVADNGTFQSLPDYLQCFQRTSASITRANLDGLHHRQCGRSTSARSSRTSSYIFPKAASRWRAWVSRSMWKRRPPFSWHCHNISCHIDQDTRAAGWYEFAAEVGPTGDPDRGRRPPPGIQNIQQETPDRFPE